ncbi:antitoxin [Kribbella sp. NPDC056861]|uniref:antitoxin n=1 Tax=Kribbella sp. NPDC056861 TaxID=3154857 RepID=UPI00341F20A3
MNDFQEQAKNWLRNVVKQNPDKIKAGVEKAGDLIDKQTGGKYAEKVDSVQEKVGSYVDTHAESSQPAGDAGNTSTEQKSEATPAEQAPTPAPGADDSGVDQGGSSDAEATGTADDAAETVDEASPDAVDGSVVGGETPDVESNPSRSAGSGTEGATTGSTVTGTSDGGLPGPR